MSAADWIPSALFAVLVIRSVKFVRYGIFKARFPTGKRALFYISRNVDCDSAYRIDKNPLFSRNVTFATSKFTEPVNV